MRRRQHFKVHSSAARYEISAATYTKIIKLH